jgi:SAM-dependent methyltransferase
MPASEIPTKVALHPLFTQSLNGRLRMLGQLRRCRLLDLGCGDGRIACELHTSHAQSFNACGVDRGAALEVHGVDVNAAAVAAANTRAAGVEADPVLRPAFTTADISSDDKAFQEWRGNLAHDQYDIVLLQLVLSVIGGPPERARLLRNAHRLLGGRLT